jgi:capsular polysaccharide transport system ATP-binding protein
MIRLERVGKAYPTRQPGRPKVILNEVTLELPAGANVAVLGRNGAGKSTLLRLMGGIEPPDTGRLLSNRRISWPVGVCGNFQGSLTGRENVKFVARIYGDNEADMRQKIAFVQHFADIGDYFDMPLKTYSSGMKSRLAFALSMAFDFDVYLVDEVLSVGDRAFRERCRAIIEARRQVSNFIVVSHAVDVLKQLCDMALYLENGRVDLYEDVGQAIKRYASAAIAASDGGNTQSSS